MAFSHDVDQYTAILAALDGGRHAEAEKLLTAMFDSMAKTTRLLAWFVVAVNAIVGPAAGDRGDRAWVVATVDQLTDQLGRVNVDGRSDEMYRVSIFPDRLVVVDDYRDEHEMGDTVTVLSREGEHQSGRTLRKDAIGWIVEATKEI